jgi:hypothetical protein
MTIWLLAVVVLASLAGLGFRQGVIRVGCSLVGILVGALLAVPLGGLVARILVPLGVKDPVLAWAVGPIIVFLLFSIISKIVGALVHQKVDVHFKYHAGDLRLAMWERLDHRLGLCLALFNGTIYLILISFLIYAPSYVTVQVATSDKDPQWMRILNQMGRDLQSSGFIKVARSIDSIPQVDYDMVDFAALLYRNSLCEARLGSYPAFLGLAERPEFQDIATDNTFTESWARMEPIMTFLDNPRIQVIRNNPALLKEIWNTAAPDLDDVRTYLKTGHSPRYEPIVILGRWRLNIGATANLLRRAKPNIASSEMQKAKRLLASFDKATVVAMKDNQVLLKNVPPQLRFFVGGGAQTLSGQWKNLDGKYQFTVAGMDLPATIEGDRLTLKTEGPGAVFERED